MTYTHHDIEAIVQHANDIKIICKPLLGKDIKAFSYMRFSKDGFNILTHETQLCKEFLLKKYPYCIQEELDAHLYNDSFMWWDAKSSLNLSNQYSEYDKFIVDHGFEKGITLFETNGDSIGLYDFCVAPSHPCGTEYLLGQLDTFKKFIFYFKEKVHANPELKTTFYKKYPLLRNAQPTPLTDIPNIDIRRYYLGDTFGKTHFTPKEMKILKLVSMGLTAKLIAKEIGNSFRTIQNQLMTIRKKSFCDDLSDLRQKLASNASFQFYLSLP
ncbi:MAG: hypothetical protein JW855_03985 [Gammaproteobacteria bacterium]|nr:hypothetical protein [Gammaproteobacteria bacterium]